MSDAAGECMRVFLTIASLVWSTTGVWAGGTGRPSSGEAVERTQLTAQEVARYAAPYAPQIKACYLAHARGDKRATGQLSLQLVIQRDGDVDGVAIEAPGVTAAAFKDLERCVRHDTLTWHFPVRRDVTTAVVPYLFLSFDLPGTGPQYTCWNPRGCPAKPSRGNAPTAPPGPR